MSLVDDVFGSLPGPLISEWGISAIYIKQSMDRVYDPETGTFEEPTPDNTRVSVKLVPLKVQPNEVNGEIQLTDVKFIISADELGDYFPKTQDLIEYEQSGVTRTAKIIAPISLRGSQAIMHTVIARLS